MSYASTLEIQCSACGKETLLVREAQFDGFKRTEDKLSCSGCGHVYASEDEVPFKTKQTVHVFSEQDRSDDIEVFSEDEKGALCRYCRHYVVNPFTQWCGLHKKEVESTDTCPQFEPGAAEDESDNAPF